MDHIDASCIYLKGLDNNLFTNSIQICTTDLDYNRAYNYYIRGNYHTTKGAVEYELTNHLGNVMATYTDRKRAVPNNSNAVEYYYADITNSYHYYAFGSPVPQKTKTAQRCHTALQATEQMDDTTHINTNVEGFNTTAVWPPYGTNATTAADVSNSQMIVDNVVPGEGTEKTGFLIESNKLNFISVDLENVSYSLGIKVEIYSSGGSTLLASSGPIGITGPQHLLFPIDFSMYPTVSAVDIRIIGENGTTCTSCPAENFTVQNVVCYVLDTSYIYPTTTVSICDGEGRYRYGFNRQEKDNEVYGNGNLMNAKYWEYDSRLGRRWNIDPNGKEWESPYSCFHNNPIYLIDPDGLTPKKHKQKLTNSEKKSKKYREKFNEKIVKPIVQEANRIREANPNISNQELNSMIAPLVKSLEKKFHNRNFFRHGTEKIANRNKISDGNVNNKSTVNVTIDPNVSTNIYSTPLLSASDQLSTSPTVLINNPSGTSFKIPDLPSNISEIQYLAGVTTIIFDPAQYPDRVQVYVSDNNGKNVLVGDRTFKDENCYGQSGALTILNKSIVNKQLTIVVTTNTGCPHEPTGSSYASFSIQTNVIAPKVTSNVTKIESIDK